MTVLIGRVLSPDNTTWDIIKGVVGGQHPTGCQMDSLNHQEHS